MNSPSAVSKRRCGLYDYEVERVSRPSGCEGFGKTRAPARQTVYHRQCKKLSKENSQSVKNKQKHHTITGINDATDCSTTALGLQ